MEIAQLSLDVKTIHSRYSGNVCVIIAPQRCLFVISTPPPYSIYRTWELPDALPSFRPDALTDVIRYLLQTIASC